MNSRTTIGVALALLVWATLAEAGCAATEDEGEASHFFDCDTDADCPEEQVCSSAGEGSEKRCSPPGVDSAPLGSDDDGGVPADSGSVDSGGDIHDLVCGECRVIEVNDRGDVVYEGTDLNCDGVAEEGGCNHLEYDESGNQILFRTDSNCNGLLDDEFCGVSQGQSGGPGYSSYGDVGCDGVPDQNCYAGVTTAEGTELYTTDDACDGVPDDCAERDPVTQIWSYDEGCDGVLVRCELIDDEGHILGHDDDCDGTMDTYCVTILYDDLGRLERYESDEDCDGTLEWYSDMIYAADGLTYREEIHNLWNGGDRCYEHSVQSEKEHNFSYQDLDCDGVPDSDCREDGTLTRSTDGNCDRVFDTCSVALDGSGAILEAGDGERCLGTPSECVFVTSR